MSKKREKRVVLFIQFINIKKLEYLKKHLHRLEISITITYVTSFIFKMGNIIHRSCHINETGGSIP